jgi:DNA segregation ATPase FtsK/SpoIIIE-like protein
MARGRKGGPSRMDLRREAEAVEARDKDEEKVVSEDDDEEEDEEEEADEEAGEAGDADDEGGDDDEDAPKPKKAKKKAEPKPKKAPVKRTRAVKEVRMKALWVVFDNGGKRVKEFPYANKAGAETLLAEKMGEEKKGTYYLQLVKEPLEA